MKKLMRLDLSVLMLNTSQIMNANLQTLDIELASMEHDQVTNLQYKIGYGGGYEVEVASLIVTCKFCMPWDIYVANLGQSSIEGGSGGGGNSKLSSRGTTFMVFSVTNPIFMLQTIND